MVRGVMDMCLVCYKTVGKYFFLRNVLSIRTILRRMAPAPLLVFPCVDHVDRLQLNSGSAQVEFRAAAHGQS